MVWRLRVGSRRNVKSRYEERFFDHEWARSGSARKEGQVLGMGGHDRDYACGEAKLFVDLCVGKDYGKNDVSCIALGTPKP